MYLCFEEDDKRIAIPEHSLVNMDENGFTIKAIAHGKSTRDMIFLKIGSYQGCVPDFTKALGWIKKKPKPSAGLELEITNSAGLSLNAPPAPKAKPKAVPGAAKLPETPTF